MRFFCALSGVTGKKFPIPCKSDPDLCMQLDAWDAETSIPALLNGEHSVLYRTRYDQQSDAWIMRLA
ncbi:DUF1480 family protein [Escherichia sp. R-CC3]